MAYLLAERHILKPATSP